MALLLVVTAVYLGPTMVSGYVDEQFEPLREIFRENLDSGLEEGASFAVFHKGRLVVDLYGGIADREKGRQWSRRELSVLFSTTKSISAVILAYVMTKNGVSYDEKVTSIWPEFGAHGKENITISNIVLHQAGLPYSSQNVTRGDVQDWRKMSSYFENATPVWSPGSAAGYHALTFGFLIDQLVRRIDEKKRGVVDVFREDFIEKYGIHDLYIGLPSKCTNNRVAILEQPTEEEIQKEAKANPQAYSNYMAADNDHHLNLYKTWSWITIDDYNELENRLLPMPSNMGIGGAKGLAEFHSVVAQRKVFNQEFFKRNLSKPVLENELDVVNGYPESKGYGFQFTRNPKGQWIFGHSGFGGQNVRVDVHNELAYAYVSNHLKISDADLVRPWRRLVDKLYQLMP